MVVLDFTAKCFDKLQLWWWSDCNKGNVAWTCVFARGSDWVGNPHVGNPLVILEYQRPNSDDHATVVVPCVHFIDLFFYVFVLFGLHVNVVSEGTGNLGLWWLLSAAGVPSNCRFTTRPCSCQMRWFSGTQPCRWQDRCIKKRKEITI